MREKLKNGWQKVKYRIGILVVPIVLLFAPIGTMPLKDRLNYFWDVITKYSPLLFLYTMAVTWYDQNKPFALAMGTALLLNLIIGARYHWLKGTFNLTRMMIKNIELLAIVAGVYMLLKVLTVPLEEWFVGTIFKATIEFISILLPTEKALKNMFIITNGKHPPAWVIKALYNYQKEGKLKDFFDMMNGEGIRELEPQKQEEKDELITNIEKEKTE